MKKHFKVALRNVSIAAMLLFASNGLHAMVSDAVSAPIQQPLELLEPLEPTGEPSPMHKIEDVMHHTEDEAKTKGHHMMGGMHAAFEKAREEWAKSENSLASMAEKTKTEAPKALADISSITDATQRRLELFKHQAEGGIDAMSKDDQATFANQLKTEATAANQEFHQIHELVGATEENNPKFAKTMMADVHTALGDGEEHFHHHDAEAHHVEGAAKEEATTAETGAKEQVAAVEPKAKGKHKKGKSVSATAKQKKAKKAKPAKAGKKVAADGAAQEAPKASKKTGKGKHKKAKAVTEEAAAPAEVAVAD